MALCDFIIGSAIQGYDCTNPTVKGAESEGLLINRSDIANVELDGEYPFAVGITMQSRKRGHRVFQYGNQPWNGTQQEMSEGTYQNTITNTVQFVVLKQDKDWASQLYALVNGEFVAVLQNKNGTYQVYGVEAGLHCTGAVRELYNDDTLSGWLVTMTEEGAARGNLFITAHDYRVLADGVNL